jgi:hypothetical protein
MIDFNKTTLFQELKATISLIHSTSLGVKDLNLFRSLFAHNALDPVLIFTTITQLLNVRSTDELIILKQESTPITITPLRLFSPGHGTAHLTAIEFKIKLLIWFDTLCTRTTTTCRTASTYIQIVLCAIPTSPYNNHLNKRFD